MIFEADPDQIKQLDSLALVRLMRRLMLAECSLVDIPLRAATVPLQITVSDGGEDGRVEWTGGVDDTNYFPARFSAFQSKAQNLTETSVKAEISGKKKGGKATLRDVVSEVLSRRGNASDERLSLRPVPQSRGKTLSKLADGGPDPHALGVWRVDAPHGVRCLLGRPALTVEVVVEAEPADLTARQPHGRVEYKVFKWVVPFGRPDEDVLVTLEKLA
jgi:hypothetical protein